MNNEENILFICNKCKRELILSIKNTLITRILHCTCSGKYIKANK